MITPIFGIKLLSILSFR